MGYRRTPSGRFRKSYLPLVAKGVGLALTGAGRFASKFSFKKAKTIATPKAAVAVISAAKRTRKRYVTGASYRGRFTNRRFARKRGSAAAKGENYFATNGVTDTMEVSGTISDPDCVYVGHSSFSPMRMLEAIVQSVLRKLYSAAIGYDLSSINQTIPYKGIDSDGHTITVSWRNPDGTTSSEYHAITVGMSIQSIAAINHPVGAIFKNVVQNDVQLMRITITDKDTNLTRATLDLTKTKIEYYFKSELKVQNVTISNLASDEADDVNNVPLVGRNYEFKSWHPDAGGSTALTTINLLAASSQSWGVSLVRGAQMEQGWREPPPSKVFTGVTKSEKIRIQPGHIKSDWLIDSGSMTLDRLLHALHYDPSGGNDHTKRMSRRVMIGRHSLCALEKVISIFGTLPIKVFYECNFFLGVAAKCGFSHGALGTTYSHYQDNVA